VQQAHQAHVVVLADAAVGIDAIARHDEQRDAAGARRRALDTGQYEVNDVLRQFVLAAADPLLGAVQ